MQGSDRDADAAPAGFVSQSACFFLSFPASLLYCFGSGGHGAGRQELRPSLCASPEHTGAGTASSD